ncbi:MAG: methyltransferase [Thermodesulfobacteriota bacterium]|nr:methyltransferase [Thermodesulfobacteriota bacterium]
MRKDRWSARELLGLSGSYWQTCALHAGVHLRLFSMIGDHGRTADDIAKRLEAPLRGVEMLLNALCALALLGKEGELYVNTPESKTLLVEESAGYIGHIITHHFHLVPAWCQLPQAVVTGKPVRKRSTFGEAEEREGFLMGMYNLAMQIAPRLSKEISLQGRHHLLDLGGGPATYAIHFCLANPDLRATVYDLPTTEPFAARTIRRFGLSHRIGFRVGNYVDEGIEGAYDVAWLSHVLHGEGFDDCERILMKVVSAMESGGLILIHDFILDENGDGPLFPALFSLNMLINTDEGRSYTETQLKEMLERAGVKEARRLAFRGPNDSGIVSGIV